MIIYSNKLTVRKIKALIEEDDEKLIAKYLSLIENDQRKSVKNLYKKYILQKEKLKEENERINKMLCFEKSYLDEKSSIVAGVDEAGRGPAAGPLVISAVVFPESVFIKGVKDSKQLSHKQRKKCFELITKEALDYRIEIISSETIDKYGINNATSIGINKAISNLKVKPDLVLIDGIKGLNFNFKNRIIEKGDKFSFSIASASILSKVTRDHIMDKYSMKYPKYNFTKHKGYITKEHVSELLSYGRTIIHRKSYKVKGVDYV